MAIQAGAMPRTWDSVCQPSRGRGQRGPHVAEQAAQEELQKMLERKIHLFLVVKVRENWLEDPARYKEWGLEFDA